MIPKIYWCNNFQHTTSTIWPVLYIYKIPHQKHESFYRLVKNINHQVLIFVSMSDIVLSDLSRTPEQHDKSRNICWHDFVHLVSQSVDQPPNGSVNRVCAFSVFDARAWETHICVSALGWLRVAGRLPAKDPFFACVSSWPPHISTTHNTIGRHPTCQTQTAWFVWRPAAARRVHGNLRVLTITSQHEGAHKAAWVVHRCLKVPQGIFYDP